MPTLYNLFQKTKAEKMHSNLFYEASTTYYQKHKQKRGSKKSRKNNFLLPVPPPSPIYPLLLGV
jgi:hypothetical protein